MPKVLIVYLVWSTEPERYLLRALDGIQKQKYPKADTHLLVIYNSHRLEDESQLPFIKTEIDKIKNLLPDNTILSMEKNLGFTGGNNIGMKWAVDNGYDYVFLHNADGYMSENTLAELVDKMEKDRTIGQAQSMILLHPRSDLINSAGNTLNFNYVGFCSFYGQPFDGKNFPEVFDIGYAMAAATLLRVDLLKKHGFLCETFYLYHEDTEYSLRLKELGYRVVTVSDSIFYHEYEFSKNSRKFFWIERNRHVLKYLFYKWPTIILLLPLEILYNIGLIFVSLHGGWFSELINVYKYWLKTENWKAWHALRLSYQNNRKVSDRKILHGLASTVDTAELVVSKPIKILMNITFTIYHFLLKMLVWW